MSGPLAGIRVLELGSFIAGPFAAQLLADLGAEVLKVEPPRGDQLRSWGPRAPSGSSWWSYAQNRGKRLAAVDLSHPEGPGVIRRVLANVDVLIANLRPGTLESRGLGPEELSRDFPSLVYVAISGYGLTGPNRSLAGFGSVAESRGGLRYVTGFPDRPPVRAGTSVGDAAASLFAAVGALASLLGRERDPQRQGEVVDVALADAVLAITESAVSDYLNAGVCRERTGNRLGRAAPSNVYLTADGHWWAIGANSDALFRRLAAAMGREELADDERYLDNPGRVAHAGELDEMIAEWVGGHDATEISAALDAAGIPAGPVQSMADIAGDPQYLERDMIIRVPDPDDPSLDPVAMVAPVPRLRNRAGRPEWTGGAIGRDNAVLAEWAGIDDDELQRLLDAGVLAGGSEATARA